jgi:hypothetical protein
VATATALPLRQLGPVASWRGGDAVAFAYFAQADIGNGKLFRELCDGLRPHSVIQSLAADDDHAAGYSTILARWAQSKNYVQSMRAKTGQLLYANNLFATDG